MQTVSTINSMTEFLFMIKTVDVVVVVVVVVVDVVVVVVVVSSD